MCVRVCVYQQWWKSAISFVHWDSNIHAVQNTAKVLPFPLINRPTLPDLFC